MNSGRSNHPRTEPGIESFLSLPMEKIVEVFRDAVRHLVASSAPPTDPPKPDPSPPPTSSSTPAPLPTSTTSNPIPSFPLALTDDQVHRFSSFSDDQFRELARNLKKNQKKRYPDAKEFLSLPVDIIA